MFLKHLKRWVITSGRGRESGWTEALCMFWPVLVEVIRMVDNVGGTGPHFWWGIKSCDLISSQKLILGYPEKAFMSSFWGTRWFALPLTRLFEGKLLWWKITFCLTPWTTGSSRALGSVCCGRILQALWIISVTIHCLGWFPVALGMCIWCTVVLLGEWQAARTWKRQVLSATQS